VFYDFVVDILTGFERNGEFFIEEDMKVIEDMVYA
jgi:hypothetical protein